MPHSYILFSKILDRFYIGSSILYPADRLEKHITQYYGATKFTAKADDWELFIIINCKTIVQAQNIEKHIKRMKSSKYIRNLLTYPEIIEKLKNRYS